MSILKNIGKVKGLIINTKPSEDKKTRAKATTLDLNSKKVKFPRKTIHTSSNKDWELSIFQKEFDIPTVNEILIQITPKRLREIVTNSKEHQRIKEDVKTTISKAHHKGINIGYPLLLNQRSPHESKDDYEPFGKPTQRMLEKLFDLFDVDGMDMIILPSPSPNGRTLEWCKLATTVFKNRKPDYMNEVLFSGIVPLGNPENHVKDIIEYYLKNKIQSLTFDFCSRKVLESKMREIIENYIGKKLWEKMFIHGTNVPANNFLSGYKEPLLGLYDLLISVYGFDTFVNIVKGGSDSKNYKKNEINEKMRRKRYRLIDTYGDYNYNGLKALSENETIKIDSPIWKTNNVLDIYDSKTISISSMNDLSNELREHRNFVTHKEVNNYSNLIGKNKFLSHIENKKASAKELNSILNEFNIQKLNNFY